MGLRSVSASKDVIGDPKQKANAIAIAIAFTIAICAQQRKVRFNAKNQIFHFLYWQFNFFISRTLPKLNLKTLALTLTNRELTLTNPKLTLS